MFCCGLSKIYRRLTGLSNVNYLENSSEQIVSLLSRPFFIPQVIKLAPIPSFTLSSYRDKSPFLQNLVVLHKIDIFLLDKYKHVADKLVLFNYDRDFVPYINLFKCLNIRGPDFTDVINRTPLILSKNIEDLAFQQDFLMETLKVTKDEFGQMANKYPHLFILEIHDIRKILSTISSTLNLNFSQMRSLVLKSPRILSYRPQFFRLVNDRLTFPFPNLNDRVVIMKKCPRIYFTNPHSLHERTKFVVDVMKVPTEHILSYPNILRRSLTFLNERHELLKTFRMDKYSPRQPGFITLSTFAEKRIPLFCDKVGLSEDDYIKFVKTR